MADPDDLKRDTEILLKNFKKLVTEDVDFWKRFYAAERSRSRAS